jgi:hypothetical protein
MFQKEVQPSPKLMRMHLSGGHFPGSENFFYGLGVFKGYSYSPSFSLDNSCYNRTFLFLIPFIVLAKPMLVND